MVYIPLVSDQPSTEWAYLSRNIRSYYWVTWNGIFQNTIIWNSLIFNNRIKFSKPYFVEDKNITMVTDTIVKPHLSYCNEVPWILEFYLQNYAIKIVSIIRVTTRSRVWYYLRK